MSVSLLSLSFSLILQSPFSKQSTCQDHGRTPTLVSSTTCKPWNASDPADCPPYLNEGAPFSNNESLFFYGLCQRVGRAAGPAADNMEVRHRIGTLHTAGNPVFHITPGADTSMTPGLITLDLNTLEWTNASTADMGTFGTIGDGYVNLIESAGDQGLLVAFGG
ncbi:kelch repeat protein [Aspergillus lentulus]|nr:kelch repeat protein [Aspergillus lentulus]GFG07780.1 kelch repeat protein [Aspergillus lentulus]